MKNLNIICMLSIFSIVFICFGHKYREQVQLRLKRELISVPPTVLDWWSVSHFLLFMMFGYFEPNHHTKFFLVGFLFEILEDMLSADESTQLFDCTKSENKNSFFIGKIYCNGIQTDYWYAKWDDVIVNLLGYMLGSSLATL